MVGWKVSEVRRGKEEGKGENQGTSGKGKNKVLQQSNRLEEAAPEKNGEEKGAKKDITTLHYYTGTVFTIISTTI